MKNSSIQFNSSNIKELFSKKFLLVILISIPSAIVADYFNIPLAWMLGPMLAVSVAALSGIKIKMPKLALSLILIVFSLQLFLYFESKRSEYYKNSNKYADARNLITNLVTICCITLLAFIFNPYT